MSVNPLNNVKEVDFRVVKEDYSRYLLNDRTLLKVKVVVRKVLRSHDVSPTGYPNFGVESTNSVTAIVPESLKRDPSPNFDISQDVPEEVPFTTQEEQWQEYHTDDGFKVYVKPVLTKVFKYEKYNDFREPIYNTNIQSIMNIGKIGQP